MVSCKPTSAQQAKNMPGSPPYEKWADISQTGTHQ